MSWLKNILPSFLYSMLMTGVMMDANPGGSLRAIKELEQCKEEMIKKAS